MGIHTRIGKDDEAEGLGVARQEKQTIEQQRAAVLKVFRAVVVKPASNGPI